MGRFFGSLLVFLFVACTAGICYWQLYKKPAQEAAAVIPPSATATTTATAASSEPKYPVAKEALPSEEVVASEPVSPAPKRAAKPKSPPAPPATTVEGGLSGLLGQKAFEALINSDDLVHRIVLAVENENSHQMPPEYLPWNRTKGDFLVDTQGDTTTLSPRNYARYAAAAAALDHVSARSLVSLYSRFYENFQKDYVDLGSKGYFNDRLVEAIDDMLAAPPAPSGPIALTQATLRFHYANDDQEALSAGQKILLRIGPQNAAKLRAKLKEVRVLLTKLGKKG